MSIESLPPPQIVGVSLVRNEDLFIERALRNTIGFCDRLIVTDHHSSDATAAIVEGLVKEFPGKLSLVRIDDPAESHRCIESYAGTRTWMFGVDGDEIYDPAGLAELRAQLRAGAFLDQWMVFGNVLNCVAVDEQAGTARGYLAPPCRSMTKLFNFSAIQSWVGASHFCANGTIVFREGFDASLRLNLHERHPWDAAVFRCLHTCFMRRSSLDTADGARSNVSENCRRGLLTRLRNFYYAARGQPPPSSWKMEKYRRGELVTLDVRTFFPEAKAARHLPREIRSEPEDSHPAL